jgi:hypothetical protein
MRPRRTSSKACRMHLTSNTMGHASACSRGACDQICEPAKASDLLIPWLEQYTSAKEGRKERFGGLRNSTRRRFSR